jgi:MSHA biogenesis protein MshK
MAARMLGAMLACVAAALATEAIAEQLRDPTRPPASLAPAAGDAPAASRSAGLVLQSVLIAPDRRSAIVDGRLLKVGDSVAGFRVTAIEEGVVTLRGAAGTRRLQLFPEVEKRRSLTVRPADRESDDKKSEAAPAGSLIEREAS